MSGPVLVMNQTCSRLSEIYFPVEETNIELSLRPSPPWLLIFVQDVSKEWEASETSN